MYERAARCVAVGAGGQEARRRWLAAALTCLRLAKPEHAFLARPACSAESRNLQVLDPQFINEIVREGGGIG